jgi:hypothetical protein
MLSRAAPVAQMYRPSSSRRFRSGILLICLPLPEMPEEGVAALRVLR